MNLLKDNLAVAGLFVVLALLSVWLQFGVLEKPVAATSTSAPDDPDYYIENMTATAIGENGKRYRITADKLVHYPARDGSLLHAPHIIQYNPDQTLKRAHAESGWLHDDHSTLVLTGKARVIQSHNGVTSSDTESEKMTIHLKDKHE